MQQNPHHYSLPMRILGSDAVAWMQEKGLGAGVWFNVGVEVNGKVRFDFWLLVARNTFVSSQTDGRAA